MQGVTLGGTGKQSGKRHPTLADNVVVGAGAKVSMLYVSETGLPASPFHARPHTDSESSLGDHWVIISAV
jgi:hypothetical protein